ncbi:MAG: hypothetical protein JRJ38_09260 [Deltaproteobacteria bacterium]|nr:hypothetical protein [Deltaproteobacteria bacterium]
MFHHFPDERDVEENVIVVFRHLQTPMAVVCLIAGMSAQQRSLRDRPRNRPENEQRGNGPHFQLSEIVVANAANCSDFGGQPAHAV